MVGVEILTATLRVWKRQCVGGMCGLVYTVWQRDNDRIVMGALWQIWRDCEESASGVSITDSPLSPLCVCLVQQ